jgi:hypothetical protein
VLSVQNGDRQYPQFQVPQLGLCHRRLAQSDPADAPHFAATIPKGQGQEIGTVDLNVVGHLLLPWRSYLSARLGVDRVERESNR